MEIKTQLDIHDILALLPHRFPFLLVDKVIQYAPFENITALKNVTINEPFFVGHFPNQPVMPGVLMIECLAQAAAILAYLSTRGTNEAGGLYLFAGVDHVRFRRVVEPGDQLRLEVKLLQKRTGIWKLDGKAYVGDELACQAELLSARR